MILYLVFERSTYPVGGDDDFMDDLDVLELIEIFMTEEKAKAYINSKTGDYIIRVKECHE